MWQISFFLVGISLCVFAGIMIHDPRTLWSGVSFFWMMVCLAIAMCFTLMSYWDWLSSHNVLMGLLTAALIMAVGCVIAFPIALIITFFVEGVKIIRHEGMKPANLLSMAFSIMLFGYLVIWPAMGSMGRRTLGTRLYILISLLAAYLLSLLAIYSLSSVLNLIHLKKRRKADYIVVLGAGLMGERVTPLLAARIEKGMKLLERNPKAVLLMSGGQGPGEEISEGRAMADYAISHGVPAERILVEEKSKSTQENLLFARELMDETNPRVLIVTTSYHVFRALLLARQQGLRCVGFGSKTKWYFTLNALLREFAGYLSLTWKRHAAIALLTAGIVAVIYH